MRAEIRRLLDIPYVKLCFRIQLLKDCTLSVYKTSALRGGMGQMLLQSFCVADRECRECRFRQECIVQRIMYTPFDIRPEFVTSGESNGFVLECEDYHRNYAAGDVISFNLCLFGKAVVYFYPVLQAFTMLGQQGLGTARVPFRILQVVNEKRIPILDGSTIDMRNYHINSIADYVDYRIRMDRKENRMVFHTPVRIKHKREDICSFSPDAVLTSLCRRIYIMDCFVGIKALQYDPAGHLPEMISQRAVPGMMKRYSSTHEQEITQRGIRGYIEFSDMDEDIRTLLYAGEIMHIGKNTNFGFGRYSME